eukprot:scaffold155013_cov45-Prasinocladus_malaysianus.AAC.1
MEAAQDLKWLIGKTRHAERDGVICACNRVHHDNLGTVTIVLRNGVAASNLKNDAKQGVKSAKEKKRFQSRVVKWQCCSPNLH